MARLTPREQEVLALMAEQADLTAAAQIDDWEARGWAVYNTLKETADPEEIAKREAALGAALIKQRPDAKEGDFFIKEYRPYKSIEQFRVRASGIDQIVGKLSGGNQQKIGLSKWLATEPKILIRSSSSEIKKIDEPGSPCRPERPRS